VIVDPGDHLQLGVVLQEYATHDVHLPQLHRPLPFPPAELLAALAPAAELDQAVALEAAVDGRARRDGVCAEAAELVLDPARPPPRMLPAQFADQRLELCDGLMGTAARAVRAIRQRGEPTLLVAGDPGVDALT
jgi:hypothetical protein